MKPRTLPHSFWLGVACTLSLALSSAGQETLSHVRAVRLSYVSGTVTLKTPHSNEWTQAAVNTPLSEGYAISTASKGFAEVEFENGSTARIGELSEVDFRQLAMNAAGAKLTHLALISGYATFHFTPEHGDQYSVTVANCTLTPSGKSEFRTDVPQDTLRVEVFSGSVRLQGPIQTVSLSKNDVLTFNTQPGQAFDIHHGVQKDDWDLWVEARDTQGQLALNRSLIRPKGSFYGWADLAAYGRWGYSPDYGYVWAPYAPLGWTPCSLGAWSWLAAYGWTWLGNEPWGWLPYHFGAWSYDAQYGWFWFPYMFGSWSPTCIDGRRVRIQWRRGRHTVRIQAHPGTRGRKPSHHPHVAGNSGAGVPPRTPGPVTVSDVRRVYLGKPQPEGPPPSGPGQPGRTRQPVIVSGGTVARAMPSPVAGAGAKTPFVPPAGANGFTYRQTAPPTVLMGGAPERERGAFSGSPGFWGRTLGGVRGEPEQVRLGRTLGGRYPATAETTGFEGMNVNRGRQGGRAAGGGATAPSPATDRSAASGSTHASARGVSGGGGTQGWFGGSSGHASQGYSGSSHGSAGSSSSSGASGSSNSGGGVSTSSSSGASGHSGSGGGGGSAAGSGASSGHH